MQESIENLLASCIDAGMKVETNITIYAGSYDKAIIVRDKLAALTNADNLTIGMLPSTGHYVRYKQSEG